MRTVMVAISEVLCQFCVWLLMLDWSVDVHFAWLVQIASFVDIITIVNRHLVKLLFVGSKMTLLIHQYFIIARLIFYQIIGQSVFICYWAYFPLVLVSLSLLSQIYLSVHFGHFENYLTLALKLAVWKACLRIKVTGIWFRSGIGCWSWVLCLMLLNFLSVEYDGWLAL